MKEGQNNNSVLECLLQKRDLKFIQYLNTLPRTQALNKLNIFDIEFLHWLLKEIAEPKQERYLVSLLTMLIEKKKKQQPHKKILKQHLKIYTSGSARSVTKHLP